MTNLQADNTPAGAGLAMWNADPYRALFEAIDEAICIIEMIYDDAGAPCDYRFLETNDAFEQHTGLVDATGRTVLDMVPGHDKVWIELYGEVARSGRPVRHQDEATVMRRWFDVYAIRVGPAGAYKVAVLFSDVSERKLAELELQRLADDLKEADRRKTEFLATLAHELRNPLAPLRSGLQVMRMAAGDPAATARVLEVMERQLGHMVELVDDLLDVARITRGQVELKRAQLDLKDVLDLAVETALPAIEDRHHRLDLRATAEPLTLFGDATRLVQVVNNLLNNAVKYTPHGGTLTLATHRDQGEAVLTVADNGVGIAPDALDDVFGMFNQVGRSRDRTQGGLGIGLSLVRSMVGLHGGSVSAASAGPGLGSTFTVRLPLAGAAVATAPAAPEPAARVHKVRVLVVDDNRDAADTLSALLDLIGHRAQVANDGRAALEAMQDFRPQVVFLDIGMPGMNGYEVAEAIRNDRRFDQPLLVALTGWGGEDDRQRTSAAGFDLHLTKPVDLQAIEKMLADV
jgi:signal transduction histidine kinase